MHILLNLRVEIETGKIFQLLGVAILAIGVVEVLVRVCVDAVDIEKPKSVQIVLHAVPNEYRLPAHFAQVLANLRDCWCVAQPTLVNAVDHDKVAVNRHFRVHKCVEDYSALLIYN